MLIWSISIDIEADHCFLSVDSSELMQSFTNGVGHLDQ